MAGVEARRPIVARVVVCTVVEVLVAEESTPAFLAIASERLVTGAMLATRILFALIAKATCPSLATPSNNGGEIG